MTDTTEINYSLGNIGGLKVAFFRVVALFFLIFAIRYWLLVVGFYGSDAMRFDTMPTYWKVAAAVLSVVQPITALGLWGAFRWGVVVWIIVVAIELFMYGANPQLFGHADTLIIFHLSCFGVYMLFVGLGFLENTQISFLITVRNFFGRFIGRPKIGV